MISWNDLYNVLSAVIPLYVAMILAYGSVRWWKIFSPDQCSGINRFVAIFAVPLLSFHFISTNDPYAMNFRFIAADTLQKIIMLIALGIWTNFTKKWKLGMDDYHLFCLDSSEHPCDGHSSFNRHVRHLLGKPNGSNCGVAVYHLVHSPLVSFRV